MLARVEIRSQMGYLSARTQNARLEGRSKQTTLGMQGNGGAKVRMETTLPRVEIDQTSSFSSAGSKPSLTQMSEFYTRSMQKGMQRISGIVQEGLQMLRIENGGNPIASIGASKGYKDVDVTIKSVEMPDITFIRGELHVTNDSQSVKTNWQSSDSSRQYTRGSVDITWGIRPSIDITVQPGVTLNFPASGGVGANLDEAI